MGQFARPGSAIAASYHSYITENKTLHNIGLASYTRNSLVKFGKERRGATEVVSEDINEYFGTAIPTGVLLGDSATLSIMEFDKDNKRYLLKTGNDIWFTPSGNITNLKKFQEDFDLWQKGFITDDSEKWKLNYVWSKIQTSLSGCITFKADYTVLTCSQSSLVKIYFQSAGRSSTERGIAQQTSVVFAGPPARATGAGWAYGPTQETQPGQYSPPLDGGKNNPQNTVAGNMRMSYDPSTGQWESGTQQAMFRLLTDIEGVPQSDLPSNVDDIDISEFYTGSFSSKFTVGSGMIVTTENGNPYLFGPNTNGCGMSPKEKVIMVNRTPRSYKAGEHVLGSLINGEWIPIGLGMPSTVSKKLTIEWSQIQKFIADAKSFFRNHNDTRDITPARYEDYVRYKFFSSIDSLPNASALTASGNDLQRLAILNLLKPDLTNESIAIGSDGKLVLGSTTKEAVPDYNTYVTGDNYKPSVGYLEFFDADTIKTKLGGNNNDSKLRRGNVSKVTPDQQYNGSNFVFASNVSSSWGMYFPDGYTSSSVSKVKTGPKNVISAFAQLGFAGMFPIYQNTTLDFALTYSTAGSDEDNSVTILNDLDLSDPYFYHLPAQFALNCSGNQSIFANLLWVNQNRAGNFASNMLTYAADPVKGDWLKLSSANTDIYKLTPINGGSVQFTPLSLELALCSTVIDYDASNDNPIAGGYRDLKSQLAASSWTYKALGKAWDRLGITRDTDLIAFWNLASNRIVKGRIGFGNNLFLVSSANPMTRAFEIPLREDYPDGGPGILPESKSYEFSNVVGIIGARSTVTMTAGGQLTLTTKNNYGLNSYGTVGGGGGSMDMTFLGSLGSWFTDNRGQTFKNEYVQWGKSASTFETNALGTTSLWCRVYDYCPNTVYDPRYFIPLQFNGSKSLDNSVIDIDVPINGTTKAKITPGTIIDKDYPTIKTIQNPIRRNMLLTGGGFYYIKNILSANPDGITIEDGGGGYTDTDEIKFGTAVFNPVCDGNGKITSLVISQPDGQPPKYGEFADWNVFKTPLVATYTTAGGTGAKIKLNSGRIIEKVMCDKLEYYGQKMLTPDDNDGNGDDGGYVRSSKSTTFDLPANKSGRYDIFYLFINDILNYPEGSAGATYIETEPTAQLVNLEITAN